MAFLRLVRLEGREFLERKSRDILGQGEGFGEPQGLHGLVGCRQLAADSRTVSCAARTTPRESGTWTVAHFSASGDGGLAAGSALDVRTERICGRDG